MIEVRESVLIERPLSEVTSQFADCTYHATREVHEGLKFFVHEATPGRSKYRLETSLFGIIQVDEIVNTVENETKMRTEFVAGTNKGMVIETDFTPERENSTRVEIRLSKPVSGFEKFLKPIIVETIKTRLKKALDEDKRDLEGLRYCHYQAGNN